MPYSMEVLVINQEKYVDMPFNCELKLEYENGRLGGLRLRKNWPIMSSMPGIWYNIVKKNGLYFDNTSQIFNTDFDKLTNPEKYYWINEYNRKENFTPVIINEKYIDQINKIFDFLINQSPIKSMMVLPLYERGKIEVIQGPIIYEKYFDLINKRLIPFNVCTIIQKN